MKLTDLCLYYCTSREDDRVTDDTEQRFLYKVLSDVYYTEVWN